jgi:DNA-binding CsgD family transcriptional regulator
MKSTLAALRICEYISQNPGKASKQIAGALAISYDQFNSALPHVKPYCKRILCKWYAINQ